MDCKAGLVESVFAGNIKCAEGTLVIINKKQGFIG